MKYSTLIAAAILPAIAIASPFEIKITTSDFKILQPSCVSGTLRCGYHLLDGGKLYERDVFYGECATPEEGLDLNVLTYRNLNRLHFGHLEEGLQWQTLS